MRTLQGQARASLPRGVALRSGSLGAEQAEGAHLRRLDSTVTALPSHPAGSPNFVARGRARTTRWLPLLLSLAACAKAPPASQATASPDDAPAVAQRPQAPPEVTVAARVELSGLQGLACGDDGCLVQLDGVLHPLDTDTLAPGPAGPAVADGRRLVQADTPVLLGPCPDDGDQSCTWTLDADADALPLPAPAEGRPDPVATWNAAVAGGWRSPFAARVPSPRGGSMIFLPRPEPRVMVTGAGARMMPLDLPDASVRYARAVALHPTGGEAYLLAWPQGDLLAFDPDRLTQRWAIPLRPAAHGLFVDGAGRLLILEEGGTPDPDRLMDLGTDAPPQVAGDPASDLVLAVVDRPAAASTAVVDLAIPKLVWREDGRYLALVTLPDGDRLLATDRALVRLSPPAQPSPPQP